MSNLKPWREIATPHDDVLKGTFQQAEFAADLSAVQQNRASSEYQDARQFFDRTFITEGMRLLLENVIKRLTGQGGDPVVQLQTSFGGGKTHTMLAVYHLASGSVPYSELRGIPSIIDSISVVDIPKAKIAVLDGNNIGPDEVRTHGNITVHALWGELAWQLGGEDAYKVVEASDNAGTSPGKETLISLLQKCAPAVILIDELVAYIRQLGQEGGSPAGTFDANLSFIQALTEAVKQVPQVVILASLPESELEAGGERGQMVLDALSKIFGRVQALWKAVGSDEAFEIVRRRLFKSDIDQNLISSICGEFIEQYNAEDQFPNETRDAGYRERMEKAYPVHPEFFGRLYQDWSSLEKFQRTRGVLKLMAKVIHRLWQDDNRDYLITPGSLPLYDSDIRTELINYLPNGWEQIIESELDGDKSEAKALDSSNHFGSIIAARRVARTIFLATAPPTPNQTNRGIELSRILLGSFQPGQQVGWFKDALNHLNDKLHYLNNAGGRYFLDTKPNLRRTMEDRRNHIPSDDVSLFIRSALQQQVNVPVFDGVHVFTPSADVPDDAALRLVVLPFTQRHFSETAESEATKLAWQFIKQRGEQPRLFANRLIFLAADEGVSQTMKESVRSALAWKSIVADATDARLNLDQFQLKQARQTEQHANEVARRAVLEAYRWLITPCQSANLGQVDDASLELHQISSVSGISSDIDRTLRENEEVIATWAPIHLTSILKKWYWQKEPHVTAKQIWDDFCKYLYLPRLRSRDVLEQTIAQALSTNEYFGLAYGIDDGRYVDAHLGDHYVAPFDSSLLLVEPKAIAGFVGSSTTDEYEVGAPSVDSNDLQSGSISGSQDGSKGSFPKRFIGRTVLDRSTSAPLAFKEIYDEVIAELSKDASAKVKISVDIEAENPSGYDEHTQRAVKENARQLNLQEYEFEEGDNVLAFS